jgi:hypothetical protein
MYSISAHNCEITFVPRKAPRGSAVSSGVLVEDEKKGIGRVIVVSTIVVVVDGLQAIS